MKIGSFLISIGVALSTFVLAQGCSLFEGDTDATDDKLCTPGAYVFCRCADRTAGTKLCQGDGRSFDACQTSDSGECVGGEIPDERTGDPLRPDELPGDKKDPPNAINACPGKSLSPTPNVEVVVEGDTSTSTGDRSPAEGACKAGAGAKDHVYHVVPQGSGKLQVTVESADGALSPIVYLRTSCDDDSDAAQVSCIPSTPDKVVTLNRNVKNGQDYYLFIDGSSSTEGKYKATVKFTTQSFCGDGQIDQGEACDDGNNTADDGCGAGCRDVDGSPASGASCPGQPVHLWPNQTVQGKGSTTAASYGNAWASPSQSCDPTGKNSYNDHIYAVTPHATGSLLVSVKGSANFMFLARQSCDTPESSAAYCANDESVGGEELLLLDVTKDQTVYIAVDGGGVTNNKGDYDITFELE